MRHIGSKTENIVYSVQCLCPHTILQVELRKSLLLLLHTTTTTVNVSNTRAVCLSLLPMKIHFYATLRRGCVSTYVLKHEIPKWNGFSIVNLPLKFTLCHFIKLLKGRNNRAYTH